MKTRKYPVARLFVAAIVSLACAATAAADTEQPEIANVDISRIDPQIGMGFAHNFWPLDRLPDMDRMEPNSTKVLADLEGPGIIRQLYYSDRVIKNPDEETVFALGGGSRTVMNKRLTGRGVILEIYFDNAEEPAVRVPAADFFLMGCNTLGYSTQSKSYATNFIVNNDNNQQSYFPMPFRERAKIVVRNDTPYDLGAYDFVEWEKVDELPEDLGYFHATYSRRSFQMDHETDITFLEIEGTGQLVGRQFSYVTDEPRFNNATVLMEGNLEIDIDGQNHALDYLGTECAFNFGWGWRRGVTGPRSGTTYTGTVEEPGLGELYYMSTYRFYDHMPIRFNESIRESIDWTYDFKVAEQGGRGLLLKLLEDALEEDGAWVDMAVVYYWYQTEPGGFQHEPLRPYEERIKAMLKESSD